MGNIESVDGQSEMMKHHIMPLKVPMPDPNELEEKFAIVLVSFPSTFSPPHFILYHLTAHQEKKSATLCFHLNFRCVTLHGDNKIQTNKQTKLRLRFVLMAFRDHWMLCPSITPPLQGSDLCRRPAPLILWLLPPLQALSCGSFVCHKVRQLSVWPRQRGGGMGWRGGDGGGAVLLLV